MSSAMSSAVADDTSRRHPHSVSNLAFHNETSKSCSLNADCRRMNHVSSKCYRARTDPIEVRFQSAPLVKGATVWSLELIMTVRVSIRAPRERGDY